MSSAAPSMKSSSLAEHPTNPVAAVLSYLIPGLGQIYQGRIAKGLLFFVCVYTLFFLGVYLGSGTVRLHKGDIVETYTVTSNVYLPDTADQNNPFNLPRLAANLYNRPQFAGQFWVGIAAWPAVYQYIHFDRKGQQEVEEKYAEADGLQLSDPEKAEQFRELARERERQMNHPLLGSFQREPSAANLNAVHNA